MTGNLDKKLVKAILKGEERALLSFYQAYKKSLYRQIFQKIANQQDAEEILQDSFLSILDSLAFFDFRSSLKTFCFAITRHEIADFYRKKKIKEIVFSKVIDVGLFLDHKLVPERQLSKKELRAKIFQTLGKLPTNYQLLIELKYIKGKSVKEIAGITKKTVKATESALFRARLAFQKLFLSNSSF